jgi:hypothetical protein
MTRSRLLSLVLVPAALTLVVTAVRLFGEVQGWSPRLSSNAPGGGGALLGITWLVPLFGAWFGLRLAQTGSRPARPARAVLLLVVAVAVYASGFRFAGMIGGATRDGLVTQILCMGAVAVLAAFVSLLAWPTLFVVNTVYGLLARVPTALITWFAVHGHWGTHYEKFGSRDFADFSDHEAAFWLGFTQLVFWVPFTAAVGGLFGAVASVLVRRPPATS